MESETISKSISDGICVVKVNRPNKYNALSNYINTKMLEYLEEAKNDASVKIVYFTGTGPFFTSGNDFNNFTGNSYSKAAISFRKWMDYLIEYPKILVAGVNGLCVGIGFTMLPHFDVVLAAKEAVFFAPFTQTFQSPEGCSTALFEQAIGTSNARHCLLLGGKLTAEDLHRVGFITHIWEAEQFEEKAMKYCKKAAKLDGETMMNNKRVLKSRNIQKLKEVNMYEAEELRESWEKEKFKKAIAKFVKPKF